MILDLILLFILAWAAYNGWRSGAISMLLSVVILIAAALIASRFGGTVGAMLGVGQQYLRPVIGFFFLLIVLLILGNFIKRMVRPKQGLLRGFDGALGAILALVRGVFILSLIFVVLRIVHMPPESVTKSSSLYEPVLKVSSTILGVLRPLVNATETTVALF
ncbi:MAG: CvpA family protein [Candidatus Kapaibacterium sp.]|jgi:uncharacterized membrane protein required for colicin V production